MHNPRMLSRLFAECPRLMQATMETVVRDFRRADMRLSVVGRMDATQRLAHFLLELYDRMAQRDLVEGDGERFPFPLQRRHLADTLGMSGTHVSRSLSELHDAGLVDITDGFLVIRNREGLADLSGYRAYDGMGRQAIL